MVNHNRLFNFQSLTLFALLGGAAIFLTIPTREQVARWTSLSHLPEKAELYFQKAERRGGPLSFRAKLAHLNALEEKGDIDQAIVLADQLLKERPRMKSLWTRYIQLLEWNGRTAQALLTRERAIDYGVIPSTRETYLNLISEYRWINDSKGELRVTRKFIQEKLFLPEDIDEIIQSLLTYQFSAEAEQFIREGIQRNALTLESLQNIFWLYRSIKRDKDALQLGLDYLQSTGSKSSPNFTRDIADLLAEMKRFEECFPLYQALHDRKELPFDHTLYWIELLIENKHQDIAKNALTESERRFTLGHAGWRSIARLWSLLGNNARAVEILRSLLREEQPPFSSRMKPLNWLQSAWEKFEFYPSAHAARAPLRMSKRDRLKNIEMMLELANSSATAQDAIQLLQGLWEDVKAQRIRLTTNEKITLLKNLAAHHTWVNQPGLAIALLDQDPALRAADPELQALYAVSLWDTEQWPRSQQAFRTLECAQIQSPELKTRCSEIKGEIKRSEQPEPAETAVSAPEAEPAAKDYPHRIRIEPEGQFSQDTTALSLSVQGAFQIQTQRHLSLLTQVQGLRTTPEITHHSAFQLGLGHIHPTQERQWEFLVGPQIGPNQPAIRAQAEYRAAWGPFRYFSLFHKLAQPMTATLGLIQQGAAESLVGNYFEISLNSWAELRNSVQFRAAHLKTLAVRAQGIDETARVLFLSPSAPIRFGPWAYFLDWTKRTDAFDYLLPHRNLSAGGWINTRPWEIDLSAGIGQDLTESDHSWLGFAELGKTFALSSRTELSLMYQIYSGQLTSSARTDFHLLRGGLTWHF